MYKQIMMCYVFYMQLETLDSSVREYIHDYIKNVETAYEQRIRTLQNSHAALEYKYQALQERYDLLMYKRFVRSAERLPADEKQPLLFTAEAENDETTIEAEQEQRTGVHAYTRKKKGRKALDPNLPREERVIDITEEEKICACGATLTRIGEETSEKLHIIAPRIYVEKIIRPKYACRSCEGTEEEEKPAVRIAAVEPTLIPRSIVTPSLLSCIMIQKFEDHLPYFRQEKQFERIGVVISRQDMSNWQQQAYTRLAPVFDLLKETVKSGPVLQMDETTVQVMGEEGREDRQKSYMWLARGGPPGKNVIWYEYRKTRGACHAKAFLEGYSGYLQTDGYEGYDAAVKGLPGVIHVGCFAHARRKFFEAAKVTKKPQSAEEGIKYIRKLYALEDELRVHVKDKEVFLRERKRQAEPVLEEFKRWLIKRSEEVPPSLLLGKAIWYSLGQWEKMTGYLESPYLTPDKSLS